MRGDARPTAASVGGAASMTGGVPTLTEGCSPAGSGRRKVQVYTARSVMGHVVLTDVMTKHTTLLSGSLTSVPAQQGKVPQLNISAQSSKTGFLPQSEQLTGMDGETRKTTTTGLPPTRCGLAGVDLFQDQEHKTLDTAVESLKTRLDPGSRETAAQDFGHTVKQLVADYIRQLEQML